MTKRIYFALAFVLLAAVGAAQIMTAPFKSFDVTLTTTAATTNWWVEGGLVRIVLDDDDVDAAFRWSKDYLLDGDFEDPLESGAPSLPVAGVWTNGLDVWDDNGALQGPWSQVEAAGGSVEVTATELFGNNSALFDASGGTAVVEMGANMAVTTNLTSWTVNVNAGTGTGAVSSTTPHTAGGQKILITGGDAHVDVTQAITVVAATEYFVTFWWTEAASDDLCDFRIVESTGGTDYLQADGTWGAGAVDIVTTDGDSSAAYEQGVVSFTTDAGITGITIWFAADVSADVCSVDDVSMALVPGTAINTRTTQVLTNTTTGSYTLEFFHSDGGTDSVLQYQLQDASLVGDDTASYYSGSAWGATEVWINAPNSATSLKASDVFEAAATVDRVIIRFRALMGTAEDITLDNVSIVETALVSDLLLNGVAGGGGVVYIMTPQSKGRFSFIGATQGANFSGQFYGGE